MFAREREKANGANKTNRISIHSKPIRRKTMATTETMKTVHNNSWLRPVFGAVTAVAVSTAVSVGGLSATFNALSLLPLMFLFWYLERLSRAEMGLVWGKLRHYGLALLYPALVLGLTALIAWISAAVNTNNIDWPRAALDTLVLVLASTIIGLLTEEGFFRGWLWSSFQRAGLSQIGILLATSLAFAAWHVSIAVLDTGFSVAPAQVPVYIFNVFIGGGLILGLVRLISGSAIVASVSHGLWNGIGYTLLGSGSTIGLLGIQDTAIFGPEVGLVGVVLNVVFAAGLLLWYWRQGRKG
jgi:membrane protease YdiL (CAAX protease family)